MSETTTKKLTKSGTVAALINFGYETEENRPPALAGIQPAERFTPKEREFAEYLIHDTDFGGAWNDAEQINMHLA